MHGAAQHGPGGGEIAFRIHVLCRCYAIALVGGRQVAGVLHAQGHGDVALRIDLQRQAGDALHQRAEGDEVLVAVAEDDPRRRQGGGLEEAAQAFLAPMPRAGEVEVGRQAGVVREALADGDVLLAVGTELGEIVRDWIVDADLALLVELHHGGGGNEVFGERGHVEDGVLGHGFAGGHQRALAVGAMENDMAVVANDNYSAGQLVVLDRVVDHNVDRREGSRRGSLGGLLRDRRKTRNRDRYSKDSFAAVADHAGVALSCFGSSRLAR